MSAIPQAITPNSHTNLLNAYIQIAIKMKFQQTNKMKILYCLDNRLTDGGCQP
jgi:hypothetical protein